MSETMSLPVPLNEQELIIKGNELSVLLQDLDDIETRKKDANSAFKSEIDELSEVLRALQVSRKAEALKTGRRGHGTVFQVRYEQFHEAWRRAQAQADVRYRSPHSIRHTYASQMLAAGCDIAWLANQLGHASAAVTLGIYAHFIPGKKQQAANVLDRKNANKMQIFRVE